MSRSKTKKKSKATDIVYYIIMLILLAVMAVSGFKVYKIASEYKKGTEVYDNIAEEVGALPPPEREEMEQVHLDTRLDINWGKLEDKNSDIKAWIRCMGTVINYPIVQGSDNDYYLTHLLDGTWNNKGTLFVDYRCGDPFNDFLTIVYGHRMKDKSMFYLLGEYFENKELPYFAEHPKMELYTPEKNYDVQIFAAAVIDSRDEFLYNFYLYDEDEQQRYINWLFSNNQLVGFDNSVSVTTNDHIILMSTCTLRGSDVDDNRVVVWGKLVEVDRDLSGN
ncbi:MAG: class B sortase [Firmicutes bacterium]|nr:class B sortase [Bacillota bacterium]